MTVPDGIGEVGDELERGAFRRPVRAPLPEHSLTSVATDRPDPAGRPPPRAGRPRRRRCDAALGLAVDGAARRRRSRARSPSTSAAATRSRSRVAPRRCTSRTWRRGRTGRRGDRPLVHVRRDGEHGRLLRRDARLRRHRRTATTSSIDPDDVVARITPRTKAVTARPLRRLPRGRRSARGASVDEHGLALIEDVAHATGSDLSTGRQLGTWGLAGTFSLFSNKVLSVGEGGVLTTDDDEVAATARSLRSHAHELRDLGVDTPAARTPTTSSGSGSTTASTSPRHARALAAEPHRRGDRRSGAS